MGSARLARLTRKDGLAGLMTTVMTDIHIHDCARDIIRSFYDKYDTRTRGGSRTISLLLDWGLDGRRKGDGPLQAPLTEE